MSCTGNQRLRDLQRAEKKEQKILRMEYLESVKSNLRVQLNNIDIEEKDGTVVNLGGKNTEVNEIKKEIREKYRRLRHGLPLETRKSADEMIAKRLFNELFLSERPVYLLLCFF